MDSPEIIYKYFKDLSPVQKIQFCKLGDLYENWNQKINLISRKDLDHLYERHVLHSLAIAQVIRFKPGTNILDVGTGGGFPGIPLAILFPGCQFHLIDSTGKKIKVVNEIIRELDLKNTTTENIRSESINTKFDFIVCRAVARMKPLYYSVIERINNKSINDLKNGLICLKGGNIHEEMQELNKPFETYELKNYYTEEFFETKKIVLVPKNQG